jgi:hypothetical protein
MSYRNCYELLKTAVFSTWRPLSKLPIFTKLNKRLNTITPFLRNWYKNYDKNIIFQNILKIALFK